MLKNIKSSYFIKIIFSCLFEKQKLKIVKYNKSLQKNIDINLINYKFYSDRYIIYENGKGKEYIGYDSELIFEGEYKHGEKNGRGKEYHYFFHPSEFEGEYKNGKKMEKERNG